MPAPASTAELAEFVRKSELVPPERLDAEFRKPRYQSATVDAAAQGLIDAGLLTRFQCRQIKLGRYKRFEIAGKYRLLELLGVGGMGAVYLCEHKFMKRLVALKVLPVEKLQDPSALLRFYREARAVAALDHPNIVRAYDIDKFDQMHFLVMEYVDGASIQEVVARHGPLDPVRAANYVAQSALGLHHATELGMVHRDIKPGNLLLERSGTIKILDMGLARFFDQKHDDVTEKFDNNCVLGTADYLAPEQAVSNVVDIRADIYALGGTLYFMLTGQVPFPEGTIAHKLLCHQKEEPKPVRSYRSDVPAELLAVLDKMMKKNPAERYQTPAELYRALDALIDPAPVPPPRAEMPDLCPAVLNLMTAGSEKARAAHGTAVQHRPLGAGQLVGSGSDVVRAGLGAGAALADLARGGSSGSLAEGRSRAGLNSPSTAPSARAGAATAAHPAPTSAVPLQAAPAAGVPPGQSPRSYFLLGVGAAALVLAGAGGGAALIWLVMRGST